MITVIPLGSHTTSGADAVIELVKRNKSQLISVAKVVDGEYCSLLAVFNKGSLGELVAFVNEWGTGSGGWFSGWEKISRVEEEISAEGIELAEYDLSSAHWSPLQEKIGQNRTAEPNLQERMEAWGNIALYMCDDSLSRKIEAGMW